MQTTKVKSIQNVPSYLPLFSGFFNTIWSSEYHTEQELEWLSGQDPFKNYSKDMLAEALWDNIDYEGYQRNVSEAVAKSICAELQSMGFIDGYEYEQLRSPRQYNYHNDSINLIYHLTDVNINNIRNFLSKHWLAFEQWIEYRYSSRPGFIPHYSNDAYKWEEETDSFTDFTIDGHRLGSIFDFIFGVEGMDEEEVYYVTEFYLGEFIDHDGIANDLKEMVGGVEYLMSEFVCAHCGTHLNELNSTDEGTITKAKSYRELKNKTPKVLCERCADELSNVTN